MPFKLDFSAVLPCRRAVTGNSVPRVTSRRHGALAAALTLTLVSILTGCRSGLSPVPTERPASSVISGPGQESLHFEIADFFKPADGASHENLEMVMAPLIIQEVFSISDEPRMFGQLAASAVSPPIELPSALYWHADTIPLRENVLPRLSYFWFYSQPASRSSQIRQQPVCRGIRITLNTSGQPIIWEILPDSDQTAVLYVAHSLEEAAKAEFGPPLPGRRFSIEAAVEGHPHVSIARLIDDGPVPMGPIVYLLASNSAVGTLICRCMRAQATHLRSTSPYILVPASELESAWLQTLPANVQKAISSWLQPNLDSKLAVHLRIPGNL